MNTERIEKLQAEITTLSRKKNTDNTLIRIKKRQIFCLQANAAQARFNARKQEWTSSNFGEHF
jgi:hypothetical protein